MADPIFEPLRLGGLEVKNRILRSNLTGRFDNYDGSGTQARINWEARFALGGVGAIISSFVPVHVSGRVQPNYAHIDSDHTIPFLARRRRGCAPPQLQVHPAAQPFRSSARSAGG